jgi:hypothetical protein
MYYTVQDVERHLGAVVWGGKFRVGNSLNAKAVRTGMAVAEKGCADP